MIRFLSYVFHLTDMFIKYKIWVDPDQEYLIQYLKWVEPLLQKESGLDSFGAKVVTSLNLSGSEFYELSCRILLAEPSAQISQMID
jgi:hypothetical protein